jgi:hypothetical protein
MNAVYRDGSVWTAHSVSVDGRAAVRWYEIDVASATAIQVGTVSDPSLHFYMPGISVNASHDMVVGFTGSDASSYAGAWLTGRRATDSPGVTGPPLLYKAGLGPYTQVTATGTNRWGDYSLTSVDPLDDETFWTIQEYARGNNTWATHIAEADFGCTVSSYCTAKISSSLCAPQMSASGVPSLGLADFFLISVAGMESGVNGIMFFGLTGKAANPFQGGTLCVAPPVYRLPIRNSGGSSSCTGSFGYSLKDLLSAPVGGPQIGVGSLVTIQAWSRDVADPFGTSLSDGLSFETCP